MTVPSVVNLSEPAAKTKLEAAGFKVKVRDDYSDDVQAGFVIRQDPGEGDRGRRGRDRRHLGLSRGAEHHPCRLPQLETGRRRRLAQGQRPRGRRAQRRLGSVAKGRVYKQDPAAA